MSKFIKRHEDIAAQRRRGAGFTDAELAAAQWAQKLPEVQQQISRTRRIRKEGKKMREELYYIRIVIVT